MIISTSITSFSYALNVDTHRAINEYIVKHTINSFSLNEYMKNQLGIQGGIYEQFNSDASWTSSKKGWEWLRDGGEYEDVPPGYLIPYRRSRNHFHNPLLQLDQAGYTDWMAFCKTIDNPFLISGHCPVSAVLWAQGPQNSDNVLGFFDLNPGGDWSWQKTRQNYYNALIATSKPAKDTTFANTFRGVGQLMHLVADMSVPEHTRNDFHGFGGYEGWVSDHVSDNIPNYSPTTSHFFAGNINSIASFFDTDQYTGDNPAITLSNTVGLSEYTNANFVSPNTLFTGFPYPSKVTSVRTVTLPIPDPFNSSSTVPRQYYKKIADGDTGYLLSGIDYLQFYMDTYDLDDPGGLSVVIPPMDDNVYSDYAQRLIPRAVGYSVGLLNYFFRGTIAISLPTNGVYSYIDSSQTGFTKITLLAQNNTSTGDEILDGSIELVVKYKIAHDDPFQSLPVETDTEFSYKIAPEANSIRSIPKNSPVALNFEFTSNSIPLWATDVYLQVVYHGKLGNEDGAVAVGFKDISEPTPVDLFNNMDKICLNGNWYDAGSQAAQNAAPLGWDIYIHNITDAYLKIASLSDPVMASPADYTFHAASILPNAYYRAYILTDYNNSFNYSNYSPVVGTTPDDTFIHTNAIIRATKSGSAIMNQVDYHVEDQAKCDTVGATAPCDIRYYPLFYSFRGKNLWGPAAFITDNPKNPTDTTCAWELLR